MSASAAQRAAQRHRDDAGKRAAWADLDIAEDPWDDGVNEAATAALLAALVMHHPAGDSYAAN